MAKVAMNNSGMARTKKAKKKKTHTHSSAVVGFFLFLLIMTEARSTANGSSMLLATQLIFLWLGRYAIYRYTAKSVRVCTGRDAIVFFRARLLCRIGKVANMYRTK